MLHRKFSIGLMRSAIVGYIIEQYNRINACFFYPRMSQQFNKAKWRYRSTPCVGRILDNANDTVFRFVFRIWLLVRLFILLAVFYHILSLYKRTFIWTNYECTVYNNCRKRNFQEFFWSDCLNVGFLFLKQFRRIVSRFILSKWIKFTVQIFCFIFCHKQKPDLNDAVTVRVLLMCILK
jgi:hypothetical protein